MDVYELIFSFLLVSWVCVEVIDRLIYSSRVYLDVISIEKTGENFRLIYDVKGRFCVHRIQPEEAKVTLSFFAQTNKQILARFLCSTNYAKSKLSVWVQRKLPI